jgi:hypothetical protein
LRPDGGLLITGKILFHNPASGQDSGPARTSPDAKELFGKTREEIRHLEGILTQIEQEQVPRYAYGVLGIVLILNIWLLFSAGGTYLVLWILASLYFYVFYPLLPLALALVQYLFRRSESDEEIVQLGSLITQAKSLRIFRYRIVGIQLLIRFFILSIVPLTAGIILIYSLSFFFSLKLLQIGELTTQTSALILVQCLGILIFYFDIFLFRHQFYIFNRSHFAITAQNWRRYLALGIVGILFVFIATFAVIILLIAIVLPGFTLGVYVDVAGFIQNRTNLSSLLILGSQFLSMQYLQSILSRKIARDIVSDLCIRLNDVSRDLSAIQQDETISLSSPEYQQTCEHAGSLLLESRIHTFVRYQLLTLFPTYAVMANIKGLLTLQTLGDLEGMFRRKR